MKKRGRKRNAIILTLLILQCSAAIQQQTAVLQQVLFCLSKFLFPYSTSQRLRGTAALLDIISYIKKGDVLHSTEVPGWLFHGFVPLKKVQGASDVEIIGEM